MLKRLFGSKPNTRVIRPPAKQKRTQYPDWYRMNADVEQYEMPDFSQYERQASLMAKVSYLYTAVSITSQTCAAQPGGVYKLWGEKRREISNHALEKLMQNPNPTQTGMEFLKAHYAFFLLNGQSFWWMNSTSANAEPSEIWLIPPSQIKPLPDKVLGIKGYEYDPGDGNTMFIPEWQILHFKEFHPTNVFIGLGRVEPIASTIVTDIETQNYMRNIYGKNSGRLPGVLSFKSPIADDAWSDIKKQIGDASAKNNYMLLRNTGERGVELLNAANSIKDMEIWKGREMTEKDIYNIVAPGLLVSMSVNSTDSNSKNGNATFAAFTIYPLITGTAQKITQKLLPRFGQNMVYEFEDPRVTDRVLELQEIREYAAYHTVNEVRTEKYDSDPLEDNDPRGELFVVQINAQTATDDTEPEPMEDVTMPPAYTEDTIAEDTGEEETPDEEQPEEPEQTGQDMVADELMKWQNFEKKHYGKKNKRDFVCHVIAPAVQVDIRARLAEIKSADDLPSVFAKAGKEAEINQVLKLLEMNLARAGE